MLTPIVLLFTALMWWRADRRFGAEPTARHAHDRACWAWGVAGTLAGSVAGALWMGGSSRGAALGAVIAFLVADYARLAARARARRLDVDPAPDDDPASTPWVVLIASWLRQGMQRWLSAGIVLAGLAYAIVAWRAEVAEPPSAPASPAAPADEAASTRYVRELAAVQRRYPQFNPESTLYDRRLVAAMNARTEELRSQGEPPDLALRRAVAQLMERRSPAPVERPPVDAARERPRPCAYTSAMSDEDYRACGVQPPIVH